MLTEPDLGHVCLPLYPFWVTLKALGLKSLSHEGRCSDKMANMDRETKYIKACYLGMVLFLLW